MKNDSIESSYGTVRNINRKKLSKRKLYNRIAALTGASIIFVSGLFIAKNIKDRKVNPVQDGQTSISLLVDVHDGDTVYDIASKYYTNDCEYVYNSLSNYQRIIKNDNGKYDGEIKPGDKLSIPVVVDNDNQYYQRMLRLQNEISDIEANNYWVRYTVKPGDTITELAELSSGSYEETYDIASKILSKNNMSKRDVLRDGTQIWIVNPELGSLKAELNETITNLKDSLTSSNLKK